MKINWVQDIQMQTRIPIDVWRLGKNVDLNNVHNETSQNDLEWKFIIMLHMKILNEKC